MQRWTLHLVVKMLVSIHLGLHFYLCLMITLIICLPNERASIFPQTSASSDSTVSCCVGNSYLFSPFLILPCPRIEMRNFIGYRLILMGLPNRKPLLLLSLQLQPCHEVRCSSQVLLLCSPGCFLEHHSG